MVFAVQEYGFRCAFDAYPRPIDTQNSLAGRLHRSLSAIRLLLRDPFASILTVSNPYYRFICAGHSANDKRTPES
jgi:hypothetical protein